uniref:Uncharacterized protein n=1 Tax=Avena sativa TaxID=4498 RepID=A0ACD5X716_AVESA
MAAPNPGGGHAVSGPGGKRGLAGGGGGAGAEANEVDLGLDDLDFCGSSNPPARTSLFPTAAAAVAEVWKARPTDSHCWTSSLGGVDLGDDIWEVRFSLDGIDNLERKISESDMTYMNLLALIETEGYGRDSSMYFVRERGIGTAGMELIDSLAKVKSMLELYDSEKTVSITVIKAGGGLAAGINIPDVQEQLPISQDGEQVVFSVDVQGDDYVLTQQLNIPVLPIDSEEEPDLFGEESESDDSECIIHPENGGSNPESSGMKPKKGAPAEQFPNYIPSSPEGSGDYEDMLSGDDDHHEPVSFVLPKGVKSRAKKRAPRMWYHEHRASPESQLCLNMCFVDMAQFRRAVQQLHIAQLRNYFLHRNNPDRVIVKCDEDGCQFYMVGSQIGQEKTVCLRKFMDNHTCAPAGEGCKISAKWVAKICEEAIRIDTTTKVDTIIENAKLKYGVAVPKTMAYRAKNEAVRIVLGDHVEQYKRLRDYLQTVLDTNSGSRCIVTTKTLAEHPSKNPRFHGMFMALGASIQGFLNGCRPFIGLDGCHVKTTTGQQILAATGRDGNNNIYPIAFGLVDKEDKASWTWFLTQLKYALGGDSGRFVYYTIISDRQKGLLNAINRVFPNSPQRFCWRHIYANFQTAGFRGEELKKIMDNAAYSHTKHGFDEAMELLKAESEAAYDWLCKIPVECWALHAMDTNCKTDLIVNNLSEVFNKQILDIRGKPVRTLFEGIRTKIMVKHESKRTGAAHAWWEITPTYSEILEENKKWSRPMSAKKSVDQLWQVSRSENRSYAVHLGNKTCGCRRWDMSGIPCSHAISAIYKSRQQPEAFVNDFFKKPMYLEAYNPPVYPVLGEDLWTKTQYPDIDPPVFKVELGRKEYKRRKGKFEPPQPKVQIRMATITCSNCKLAGHRYTNCTQPLKPGLSIRKNQHQPSEDSTAASTSRAPTTPRAASTSSTRAPTPPTPAPRPAPTPSEPAATRDPAERSASAPTAPPIRPAKRRAAPTPPEPTAPTPTTTRAPTPPATRAPTTTPVVTRAPTPARRPPTPTPVATRPPTPTPASRSGRTVKMTPKMAGYFNAGKHGSYKQRPTEQ